MVDEPQDDADNGMTARDRRAQRVKQQARADAPKKIAKNVAILVVVVLLLSGTVWAYQTNLGGLIPKSRGKGHEHYVYRMFNDGTEINFEYGDYDYSATGYTEGHLHLPQSASQESTSAQYVIHAEGTLGLHLSRFFETLHMTTTNTKVTLNPVHDGGRVVANNATHAWQLWVDDCRDGVEGNFHKEPKLFGFQPLAHDRMLITFAPKDATAESLASETATIPSFNDLDTQLHETCTK